jgi:hypothetical protein
MTKKSGKRRNPTGTTGNYSSPRRGEKTKQTKVTPAKESETKGSRQTKLSFPTAGNNISPPTPGGTMALKVITPGDHAGTNRISVTGAHLQTPKAHKLCVNIFQRTLPKILQQKQLPQKYPHLRTTL